MLSDFTLSFNRILEVIFAHAALADAQALEKRPEILGDEHREALTILFDSALADITLEMGGIMQYRMCPNDPDLRVVSLIRPTTLPAEFFLRCLEETVAIATLAKIYADAGSQIAEIYAKDCAKLVDSLHDICGGAYLNYLSILPGA